MAKRVMSPKRKRKAASPPFLPNFVNDFSLSDTTSLASDTVDYLVICGRSFPNPKYGWSWYAATLLYGRTISILTNDKVRCRRGISREE